MAVKGNLDSLGLEALLRAELAANGEGRLTLRSGAHFAALHVDAEGLYVLEPDLVRPEAVIRSFVERGFVTEAAVATGRQMELSGLRLLEHLLESGNIPQDEYLEVLAGAAEDTVLDLMLWEAGQFKFEEQPRTVAPGLQGTLCVDPDGIVERAVTRLDKRYEFADALGTHTILFRPLAGQLPTLESEDDPAHAVYARLDGRTVVHEISLHMGLGRYDVLHALTRLAHVGLVRAATVEELVAAIDERMERQQYPTARALCLQWDETQPDEPGPLLKLATVSAAARRQDLELDALCALGHHYIRMDQPREAVSVFMRAMRKAPADDVVLTGLRMAAEAAGDDTVYADSALLTAQAALDEGKVENALELLEPLCRADQGNMAAHLLRARALIAGEKRAELLEQAEFVGQVLSRDGCKSRQQRDAAEFFRETIAEVAPERGDLLERFRSLRGPRTSRAVKAAAIVALVALLGVVGFVLWPTSATKLLAQAHAAVEAGDTTRAQALIAQIVERFPDSQEAEEAWLLQTSLMPRNTTKDPVRSRAQVIRDEVVGHTKLLLDALPRLPAADARKAAHAALEGLDSKRAQPFREAALRRVDPEFRTAARALLKETLERVELLGRTASAHERLRDTPAALAEFIKKALVKRDARYQVDLAAADDLLVRLASLYRDPALTALAGEVVRTTESLAQASRYYDEHIGTCKLALGTTRIEEADRRCRVEAPRLMVAGELAKADALYAQLEAYIAEYSQVEACASLIELVRKRHLPQFLHERRQQIADINGRLEEAAAAEANGDLDRAVKLYADLVEEYWLIRFENVFTLPLRVVTVPAGARVLVDDKVVGASPAIVRYPWGSKVQVRVEAEGFAQGIVPLKTAEEEPPSEITVRLRPGPQWSVKLSPRVEVRPLGVDGHVLVVDRSGHVTLYDRNDGRVRWKADHTSLEGVKSRPAVAGGRIYLARVEGRILLIDPRNGEERASRMVGRPYGSLASQLGLAAVALVDGDLIGLRGPNQAWRVSLGAVPTAGVVGAHGAFWVGTARGAVVRVDARGGSRKSIQVAQSSAPVLGLAATATGMVVSSADSSLVALTPDGGVRWKRSEVGDVVGHPAQMAGVAAVLDRSGRARLFDAEHGTPLPILELGGSALHGLVASSGVLVAMRDSGRLWAYDPAAREVVLDVDVRGRGLFGPAVVGAEHMVIVGDDCCLQLVPVPQLPAPPAPPK